MRGVRPHALAQYAVEPDDPTRQVPNPYWAALDAQLRQAYGRLNRLQKPNTGQPSPVSKNSAATMHGFKIAQRKLSQPIADAWQQEHQLEERRNLVPRRAPLQLLTAEPGVKLAPEIQHLSNFVKMVPDRTQSDLIRTVAPHYRRVDDKSRTLIQSSLTGAGDLEVTQTELRVTLAPSSSPHRTRVIAALREQLSRLNARFQGSSLRLRYAVPEAL